MRRATKLAPLLAVLLFACGKSPTEIVGASNQASEVGNGGHAVVCRDKSGEISSIRLLDFYEARTLRGTDHNLGDSTNPLLKKIDIALSRLQSLDAKRADRYRQRAANFLANTAFVSSLKLGSTKDYGYINIPSYCGIEQFCIQRPPTSPTEKRYTVNLDLWDRADTVQRAGLVLHEIIYQDAIELGHKDSVNTRFLTGEVASWSFDRLAPSGYSGLMQRLGFEAAALPIANPSAGWFWTRNPVDLGSPIVGEMFSFDVKPFVKNRDGNPLTFRARKIPGWLMMTPAGFLTGVPSDSDLGVFSGIELEASDGIVTETVAAFGTVIDAPAIPLGCVLKVTPNKVRPGEAVVFELISTGLATEGYIDGDAVTVPKGTKTIHPTKVGNFSALGFVLGGSDRAKCFADYQVYGGG